MYNPYSPIRYGCGEGFAVCMKDGDKIVRLGLTKSKFTLGLTNSSKFVTDKDGQVSLQYSNGEIRSVVQLKCDESVRDEPFFRSERVSKNKYVMSVYSVCACNGDCSVPTDDCVKSDTCSCQLKENGKQFSLHPLDNPNKPLTVKDSQGYTFTITILAVVLANPISYHINANMQELVKKILIQRPVILCTML